MVTWIAEELSLTFLVERSDGSVDLLAGSVSDAKLPMSAIVAALAGCRESWIRELLDRARTGAPATLGLGKEDGAAGRVLAWMEGDALYLLYAPKGDPTVLRRAAAADHAAGVTHEVANALTAIAGWTRMAASGSPLPERTRHALEVVQRSAREALGSARGLLRTMRDAAQPTVNPSLPERTDSASIIREVLQTLRPEVEAKGIVLVADVPQVVWGAPPPTTLRLIAGNLVRNALDALGPGDSIHVTLSVHGDRFQLIVEDDGPGMTRPTLERMFERYFTTKETGTGLGLAMVKEVVNEAGGRLEVESRLGDGARFTIWLPMAGASRMSLRPPRVLANANSTSGVHFKPVLTQRLVLVVDDDEAIRSLVRTALELHGAVVHMARDRATALEVSRERRYDIALVDLMLGEERGDELLGELRAAARIERGVLMTGSANVDLGASEPPDAILRKPFELDELHRVIERVAPAESLEAEG